MNRQLFLREYKRNRTGCKEDISLSKKAGSYHCTWAFFWILKAILQEDYAASGQNTLSIPYTIEKEV